MATAEDIRIANMALTRLGLGRITDFTDVGEVPAILTDQYEDWVDELLEDHPWSFATRRVQLARDPYDSVDVEPSTDIISHYVGTLDVHNFFTGMGPFRVEPDTGVTLPTPLVEDTNYWVIASTTTTFKLATSRTLAEAGTAVNITADPTGGTLGEFFIYPYHFEWSYGHVLPADCLRVLKVEDLQDTYEWDVEERVLFHNVGTEVNIRYIADIAMDDVNSPLFKRALALKIALDLAEAGVKTSSLTQEVRQDYLMALQRAKTRDSQEGSPIDQPLGTWAEEMGRES